jgi:hypothetical protein
MNHDRVVDRLLRAACLWQNGRCASGEGGEAFKICGVLWPDERSWQRCAQIVSSACLSEVAWLTGDDLVSVDVDGNEVE